MNASKKFNLNSSNPENLQNFNSPLDKHLIDIGNPYLFGMWLHIKELIKLKSIPSQYLLRFITKQAFRLRLYYSLSVSDINLFLKALNSTPVDSFDLSLVYFKDANNDYKNYYGTEKYYKYFSKFILTDGVKDFCNNENSFWFLDIVVSAQLLPDVSVIDFQVWEIRRCFENFFTVFATDGNDHCVYSQQIPFSDFKADKAKFYLTQNVILLPSEY